MGKINSYPVDYEISDNDVWIGSDGDNALITKNFTALSMANYINKTQLIDVDKRFVYNQDTPSSEWNIKHDLKKFPSVTVIDSAGSTVIGEITHVDANNLKLTFSASFSGKAYLN
jgi:hypothetical protein